MRKNILRTTLVILAIAGTLLAFGSWGARSSNSVPCEESMDQCCKKPGLSGTENILQTLSGQFFSSTGFN